MAKTVAKTVKVKKRCCGSRPRCKRCAVVYKRLTNEGLAERVELRIYKVSPKLKKRHLKAARA